MAVAYYRDYVEHPLSLSQLASLLSFWFINHHLDGGFIMSSSSSVPEKKTFQLIINDFYGVARRQTGSCEIIRFYVIIGISLSLLFFPSKLFLSVIDASTARSGPAGKQKYSAMMDYCWPLRTGEICLFFLFIEKKNQWSRHDTFDPARPQLTFIWIYPIFFSCRISSLSADPHQITLRRWLAG